MAKKKKSESELQASEVNITSDDGSFDLGEPVFKIEKQEHEETHGDKWDALGFSGEEDIISLITECVEEGSIPDGDAFEKSKEYLAPIIHPVGSPIQICTLLAKAEENYEVASAYPIFEGLLNEVSIGDKYTWENKLEGEVEITNISGFETYLFAPYYIQNFSDCKKGSKMNLYLAGLAYNVQDAPMEFEVGKGPFYEDRLKEFLKENPEKGKEDFKNITVRMDGLVTLFPTEMHTLFQYRGTILTLETIDFLGKKVFKAKVCIKRTEDNEEMFIFLYISSSSCKNCELIIGKDIMGVIQLYGYR